MKKGDIKFYVTFQSEIGNGERECPIQRQDKNGYSFDIFMIIT